MNERLTSFNKVQSIDANILSKDDSNISKVLLYGDHSFNDEKNTFILTASIKHRISTKLLDAPLFQTWHIYWSITSLSSVFAKKLLVNLFYLSFHFLIVMIVVFRLFCKMIFLYLVFTITYVCFINLQKFAANLTTE